MSRKRFIAGAKCPKCEQQDCIALYLDSAGDRIECVHCGYEETRPTTVEMASTTTDNSGHTVNSDSVLTAERDSVGVVQFRPPR